MTRRGSSLRTFLSRGAAETFELASAFARVAQGGEVMLLIGDLGAGKTQFVRGLAQGLDVPDDEVSSPSYVVMQSYEGRLPLLHVDLYRLDSEEELEMLGMEEEIEGPGIAAIEWADKALHLFPPGRLELSFHDIGQDRRNLMIKATDQQHQDWLERLMTAQPEMILKPYVKASS